MKKGKDKFFKDLKVYNLIMSNIWQLITILILGILSGYLLEKNATDKNINYMLFSIITFSVIGVVNFFVSIIRGSKKLEKEEVRKASLKGNLEEKNNDKNLF